MQPAAKRVKLSEAPVSTVTSDESNMGGNAVVVNAWSNTASTTTTNGDKRMTDFAYRETSNSRSRSQQQDHHHHQHARRRRRNMGLVRVPPNPSMTPIFGIDLYNLMIPYAFSKVGIGTTTLSRGAFFNFTSMNEGGHLLSFFRIGERRVAW
jgi:hypothetical protein